VIFFKVSLSLGIELASLMTRLGAKLLVARAPYWCNWLANKNRADTPARY
jgi:hypothetical protein